MNSAPLGVIAGNGRFPLLVVEAAAKKGLRVVVAAIREETSPEIDRLGQSGSVTVHWQGLGQLGRLIRTFREEGVREAVMAGQVKHNKIFARHPSVARKMLRALPDLRMLKLLASLPRRDTAGLIGGIIAELEKEGIQLRDSTFLLEEWLAPPGCLTRRALQKEERRDVEFGWPIARRLAQHDVGQTIVVKDQAVVAVEAMEGTDETVRRAARLAGGQRLTVVKVARPDQDMRFDVPVIGMKTLPVLAECQVTALAVEAGKTLILDRDQFVEQADKQGLSVVARTCEEPESLLSE